MAIRIPPVNVIAERWATITPTRAANYTSGVQQAAGAYQEGVNGAAANWSASVMQAATNGSWDRGVAGKGSFYSARAASIGSQRWGPGVTASRSLYEAGFGPYAQVIAGLTLTPRQPSGNPANLQRVSTITEALHARKMQL